jgi:MYXO-CTERM domain-containing protein
MRTFRASALRCLWVALGCTSAAQAAFVFPFDNINGHGSPGDPTGSQLFLALTEPAPGQALFTLSNAGPAPSSITRVYFDDADNLIAGIADLVNMPGVWFTEGARPRRLPGGSSMDPPFVTTPGLTVGAVAPPPWNGVNPGESLGILFDLEPGVAFDRLVDAVASRGLRVGLHVQGLQGGASASYVQIPEPAPAILALAGLGMLATLRRSRRLS